MYAQSRLVTSVRGIGLLPTTSASAALGCTGLMNAAEGFLVFFFTLFLAMRLLWVRTSEASPPRRLPPGRAVRTGLIVNDSASRWNTDHVRFLSRCRALLLLAAMAAGCGGAETTPAAADLTGQWTSTLTRPPCVGDWSVFTLQLTQTGTDLTGTLVTKDNMQFPATGTFDGKTGNIVVALPPGEGECGAITFTVQLLDRDSSGVVTAFSGQATGRCCGTILESFR